MLYRKIKVLFMSRSGHRLLPIVLLLNFVMLMVLSTLYMSLWKNPTPKLGSKDYILTDIRKILQEDKVRIPQYQYKILNMSVIGTKFAGVNKGRKMTDSIDYCSALFKGDKDAMEKAHGHMNEFDHIFLREDYFIKLANNCARYKLVRRFVTVPLSKEEYEFPIAYSIIMYSDVQMVERLLRAIYMPQNFYCIHVDRKASSSVLQAMQSIVDCFPNVFIPPDRASVFWGHISILEAEMICLKELVNYKWNYYINLSGQMFPLKTNAELVKILKMYDGANDIEGTFERSRDFWLLIRQRVSWHIFEWANGWNVMLPSAFLKDTAPHHVKIYKGSNQAALSREFALYLLHSRVAKDLMDWFSDTLAPDEYLWPTLNHNAHLRAPGGYLGDPETKAFTARVSIWLHAANQMNWSWDHWDCRGMWVRQICIFGIGDLPWLAKRPELFANKFHSDFEYLAYDCMEELHFNRTFTGVNPNFNLSYYQHLPIVKNKHLVYHVEHHR